VTFFNFHISKQFSNQLERMDETNLVKRIREERVPRHIKSGRPKKSWG